MSPLYNFQPSSRIVYVNQLANHVAWWKTFPILPCLMMRHIQLSQSNQSYPIIKRYIHRTAQTDFEECIRITITHTHTLAHPRDITICLCECDRYAESVCIAETQLKSANCSSPSMQGGRTKSGRNFDSLHQDAREGIVL